MNSQTQLLSTNEILGQAYNYAFLEIPSYHFIVPNSTAFIPAAINGKASRCLHCGQIITTAYENHGELYLDKTRLDAQKQLYHKYDLPFPAIEKGEALVYQQEGYCAKCFPDIQQKLNEKAQSIYTICSQIIQGDMQIIPALAALAKQSLPAAGMTKEQLVLSLTANETIQKILQQYRLQCQNLTATATALLTQIGSPTLEAYVGKPLNMLESMSDIYNEYTVVIPASDTPDEYFFVKSTIKKGNVADFLKLPRIDSVEKFLTEPGVDEFLRMANGE